MTPFGNARVSYKYSVIRFFLCILFISIYSSNPRVILHFLDIPTGARKPKPWEPALPSLQSGTMGHILPAPFPFFFFVPGQLCFLLEDPCLGQCERTNIWLCIPFFCVCACNISKAPPPIVGDRCNSEVGSRALHNLPCSQIFRCCWLIHFVALRAPLEASLSVGRKDKLHKILPELDLASNHGAVGNRRGTKII